MSDPLKKPLQFPFWHIPYLEKHRISELFYEIARELVIKQPDDHVLFTKQILQNAAKSRDVSRIIIITTPRVNSLAIAKGISELTGHVIISDKDLKYCIETELDTVPAEILAKCLSYLVRGENCYSQGWIMVNCIRDENDAKLLIKSGIIPTHVIHPIAPFHPDLNDLLYCNVKYNWPYFRRTINGLRGVFKSTLKEVHLGQRKLPDVVAEIVSLSKIRKPIRCVNPRVVILGPRGSGRKTQAKLLADALHLVYIDFEYLLCQAWITPNDLGQKLRNCRNEVCFHSELLSQVINKKLLEKECLEDGWVLTGYPFTLTDFKYLDSLDTPPNRVIFLECDLNICRERLLYRKVDVYSGSVMNLQEHPEAEKERVLKPHPKDAPGVIDAELNYYCQHYGAMKKYCGETANIVNGDLNERWVHEFILALILRNSPPAAPRTGCDAPSDSTSTCDSQCDCIQSLPSVVPDCFVAKI